MDSVFWKRGDGLIWVINGGITGKKVIGMLIIVATNSKPVKHGRPGIGATHSSRFIPLSTYTFFLNYSYRATANPPLQSKLFPFPSFFSLVDTVFFFFAGWQ